VINRNRILEVSTNVGCNLACSYCPQKSLITAYKNKQSSGSRLLSFELFKDYISSVPRFVDIHFSGFAEPWHAPDCTKMIVFALEKGHSVAVFTTLDQISPIDISIISGLNFKRFVVHLPDNFNEMKMTVTREYKDVLSKIKESSIKNLEFITLGVPSKNLPRTTKNHMITRRVHSRAGNTKIENSTVGTAFSENDILGRTDGSPIICRKDRMYSNVLMPNGDLQFCAMDYSLEHTIGNLSENSYAQIVNGDTFKKLLARMRDSESSILCRRCEYAQPGIYKIDK